MLERVSRRLSDGLKTGAIRPHVGATFAFSKLPDALRALGDRKTTGKVTISLTNEDAS